jgi:hypothetical protein
MGAWQQESIRNLSETDLALAIQLHLLTLQCLGTSLLLVKAVDRTGRVYV